MKTVLYKTEVKLLLRKLQHFSPDLDAPSHLRTEPTLQSPEKLLQGLGFGTPACRGQRDAVLLPGPGREDPRLRQTIGVTASGMPGGLGQRNKNGRRKGEGERSAPRAGTGRPRLICRRRWFPLEP